MASRLLLLFPCLLAILVSPAAAGIGQGNGEIGFDLGFMDFDSNINAETGGRFVIRGGYHFTNLFQLEGQILSANVTVHRGAANDIDFRYRAAAASVQRIVHRPFFACSVRIRMTSP